MEEIIRLLEEQKSMYKEDNRFSFDYSFDTLFYITLVDELFLQESYYKRCNPTLIAVRTTLTEMAEWKDNRLYNY